MIFTSKELAQLRYLQVLAAKVVRGQLQGERAMRRVGPGSGFREHRSYHAGDALRRVDWNVYARTDALVVKEFDAEETLAMVVVQDCSASMTGAAATCAAKVAAAAGVVGLTQREQVLWVPVGGARHAEAFRGRGRIAELLEAVDARPGGGTDLLASVRANLPRTSRGGVALLVSDFFDPAGATHAISYLLARRYLVRAVHIEDMVALAPPPPGRYRLADIESGRSLKLDVTPDTIDAYRRARSARADSLHAFCRQRGVGYLRVRADQPFFEIVRAAIARGWLGR